MVVVVSLGAAFRSGQVSLPPIRYLPPVPRQIDKLAAHWAITDVEEATVTCRNSLYLRDALWVDGLPGRKKQAGRQDPSYLPCGLFSLLVLTFFASDL